MPQRKDDPEILDEDLLLRRIPDHPDMISEDGNPTSANFKDREKEKELSVFLKRKTTIDRALKNHEGFGLVEFAAIVPRANNHIVDSDPILDEPNPEDNEESHCVVCPNSELSSKGIKRAAKEMSKAAVWVVKPRRLSN